LSHMSQDTAGILVQSRAMVERQRGKVMAKASTDQAWSVSRRLHPGSWLRKCWCWLTEGLRYTECCMLLMLGTAVTAWHSHTAGAAGWHGLAIAGQAIPLR
jgi:hypothetical protein